MGSSGLRFKVLGIDPGFADMGVSVVRLGPDPNQDTVEFMTVIRTKKSAKKLNVRASSDNVARLSELYGRLRRLAEGCSVVCAEAQSWPRNASSSAKVGMGWGAIVAVAAEVGAPILQVTPQEIKRVVAGSKTASKEEVRNALDGRFGSIPWPKSKGDMDHAGDALGAIVACYDAPSIALVRKVI